MKAAEFERVVRDAVASIPAPLRARLDNVDTVIADWPTEEDHGEAEVPDGYTLYGLYTGVPLTERTSGYTMVMPDRITIYRGPLTEAFDDVEHLRAEIRDTVIHEFAHFFGLSDDDLRRLGAS
ncbi:MAG: metallopeptidase family protein [Actinobacteria bacterium]|nr:metallopeptidase family protein [Actinomycetota bacterium]